MTRPIGRDRVKTTAWKGKEKKNSSSQSRYSSAMVGIMFTVKKLDTSFTRAQMWKQYNKLRAVNTVDMNAEELMSYQEAVRLFKKISTLPPKMWRRFRTRMTSKISMCCILN
jgi:hypothetical protein